ncbi:MAG: oligosaccharide flippase family protein [Pseudomonadota bacterium]
MSTTEPDQTARQTHGEDNHLADGGLILISRVIAQGSSFLIFLVAVQFLTKGEFGQFAVASSTAIMMLQIARTGWGQYILAGRVESEQIGFIFAVALIWGTIFSLIGVCVGLLVAALMSDPTLGYVIALIALTIAPACYANVNSSTMIRNGQVRYTAIIWIVAELAALAVGIATLFMGWKEYGLVASRLAASIIMVFGNLIFNKAIPTLKRVDGLFKDATKFYRDLLGSVMLGFAGANSGLYIVGFMFGEAAAGAYRAATRFSAAIKEFIWEPSGILAWKNIPPSDAELASGIDKTKVVGERFMSFSRVFSLIVCPLMLGAAAVSSELTAILLGPEWQDVGPMFMLLTITNLVWLPFYVSNSVFAALDASSKIFKLQLIHLVVYFIGLFAIGWYSPVVAAAVHIPPAVVMLALAFQEVAKLLDRPRSDIVSPFAGPFMCAAAMMAVVFGARSIIVQYDLGAVLQLTTLVLIGATSYIALVVVFCRAVTIEAVNARQNTTTRAI